MLFRQSFLNEKNSQLPGVLTREPLGILTQGFRLDSNGINVIYSKHFIQTLLQK